MATSTARKTEKLKNYILVKISEVNIVPENLVFQFFSFPGI